MHSARHLKRSKKIRTHCQVVKDSGEVKAQNKQSPTLSMEPHRFSSNLARKRKVKPSNVCRTKVSEKRLFQACLGNNQTRRAYMKYWAISRGYLRKLTEDSIHPSGNSRKISWSDQMEIIMFDQSQAVRNIEDASIIIEMAH